MKFARITLSLVVVALLVRGQAASAESKALGPVETLESIQTALTAEAPQVEVLWTSLPASYQKDIRGLIADFADNTDPKLWNATFRLIAKAAEVAREKREFILEGESFSKISAGAQGAVGAEFFADPKHWESLVSIVETIAKSEIGNHEDLKNIDPEHFLSTTGAKVVETCLELAQAAEGDDAEQAKKGWEMFRGGKFMLAHEEGDKATVKFEMEGAEVAEVHLVKVDGKWIFAEMASEFKKTMSDAKASTAQLKVVAMQSEQFLKAADVLEAGLDGLLEAESQEDFDAAGKKMAQKVGGVFAGGPGVATDVSPNSISSTETEKDSTETEEEESTEEESTEE
jgi:hypothetical protein